MKEFNLLQIYRIAPVLNKIRNVADATKSRNIKEALILDSWLRQFQQFYISPYKDKINSLISELKEIYNTKQQTMLTMFKDNHAGSSLVLDKSDAEILQCEEIKQDILKLNDEMLTIQNEKAHEKVNLNTINMDYIPDFEYDNNDVIVLADFINE